MTNNKGPYQTPAVALFCKGVPHACGDKYIEARMWAIVRLTQITHKVLWCMLNEKHFNIFKEQAGFYVHMEMTEHKFKMSYRRLRISKSSISWARLPWSAPRPQCLVQPTGCAGSTLCFPLGSQPVLI